MIKQKAKLVFNKFITEGKASDLAHKLGLEYIGYGYWGKPGSDVPVAKTVNDVLTKISDTDKENYKKKKAEFFYLPSAKSSNAAQSDWKVGPAQHDSSSMTPYDEEETTSTKGTYDNIVHKITGKQAGTNPGGFFEGKDGKKRYVKFYTDPAKSYGEVLANSLYEDLNIAAPISQYFDNAGNPGAPVGFASEIVPDVEDLHEVFMTDTIHEIEEVSKKILDGFAADCLMANWDVVGVNEGYMRNIVVYQGKHPVRIDNGSAFLCRGLEGRKADAYGEDALYQLKEPEIFAKQNPSYKEIFKAASVKSAKEIPGLKKQVQNILAVCNKAGGWQKYVESKIPDLQGKDKEQIVKMLYYKTKKLVELVQDL